MKRFLCLVFSLVFVFFSVITVYSYNQDSVYTCYNAFSDVMDKDTPFEKTEFCDSQNKEYFEHSIGNPDFKAYTLLDSRQKKIYDSIKNADIGTMSITTIFSVGELTRSEFQQDFLTEVMKAVCFDLPQIFYHSGYSASYSYTSSGYVTKVIYNISMYSDVTYSASTVVSCYNQMMSKLNQIPVDTSNRYNFVKSLHDYLCNNIIYPNLNSSLYTSDCHDAYGALVTGYAVCQGYAESFKLVCDAYNIPCVYISGTANGGGHGWNAVQMDDGKWYFIDATWDDQESRMYYDYFLVGSLTNNTYFGGEKFSEDHVNDADLFLPVLNYSETAYNRTQNHNTKFTATYNCAPDFDDNYLYLSVFDAGKSNVYYNGIYVPVNSFSNNETFSVPSGTNSSEEEWAMVLLADLNSDGECDARDYSEAVNLLFTDDVIDTTAERACDINLDGYIDVLDVAVIARASSGLNTDIILE